MFNPNSVLFLSTLLESSLEVNNLLHETLQVIVNFSINIVELVGTFIILYSAVKTLYKMVVKKENAKLYLMEGLAMGLAFKLGGEILRTVIVRDFKEIGLAGCIIVLRAALTILLHWEIKNEKIIEGVGEGEKH